MKVLKKRRGPWTKVVDCQCGARLEVTEDDCKVHDDRDGAAYVFKCPECGKSNWISKTEADRSRPRMSRDDG